jgi:hypothetical protein
VPEDDGEYEGYVKYLYERNITPSASRRGRHPFHFEEEFAYPIDQLGRADTILRFISTSDPYELVKPPVLVHTLDRARHGIEVNLRVLNDLGFGAVLDSDYLTLARGMRVELLPPQEAEVLQRLGFPDAVSDLPALLYMVRRNAESVTGRNTNFLPTAEMGRLVETLDEARKDHERLQSIEEEVIVLRRDKGAEHKDAIDRLNTEAASKKKQRRWWKGIGQIVQGAGISLGDAAVAVGLGSGGVAPAWGALISVTVGVGTIMAGIGDLRNE